MSSRFSLYLKRKKYLQRKFSQKIFSREETFANLPLIRKIKFREIQQNSSIRENFFREINQNSPIVKISSLKVYISSKKIKSDTIKKTSQEFKTNNLLLYIYQKFRCVLFLK